MKLKKEEETIFLQIFNLDEWDTLDSAMRASITKYEPKGEA